MSNSSRERSSNPASRNLLTREPKPLSNEYHRAHKQSLLWAAILLIWELVGVKLENAEGNLGGLLKAIESPKAVPWVLLVLVAYSLFKVSVEWTQCGESRRLLRASQVDFVSTWVVSLIALSVYVVQTVSHIRIADIIEAYADHALLAVFAFWMGASTKFAFRWAFQVIRDRDWLLLPIVLIAVFASPLWLLMFLTVAHGGKLIFAIAWTLGNVTTIFFRYIISGFSYLVFPAYRFSKRIAGRMRNRGSVGKQL